MTTRRELIRLAGLGGLAAATARCTSAASTVAQPAAVASGGQAPPLVKPPRLREGDLVGLVNPATARFERIPTEIMADAVESLGLRTRRGDNYYARYGNLAGTDEQRAADLNGFFADPEVRAIWATGGWGSARLLPLLDYDALRRDPKVIVGYSDATALLNGVHSQTGLVVFHGPFPRSRVSADFQKQLLFGAESMRYENPSRISDGETVQTSHRILTIRPGRARGPLLGGNLTVLSAIVGSAYLPRFDGAILFLEDVNEAVYRVDRMLTQLKLAGILDRIAGFVFGNCSDCDSGTSFGSLTLEEVLYDHIAPLGIPAWQNAMIGHIADQFTLPMGIEAEIDAEAGTISVEEAVS
ncbi:MAG: LD-carboxypeptidase [Acidobacteria bacterium]|nr:MAG: LD-carboxypeptidase [Acidobacteriota bacterium]REK07979.1 MAG: LD-carboxypeptidase [Acidobacteriota bacterium]